MDKRAVLEEDPEPVRQVRGVVLTRRVNKELSAESELEGELAGHTASGTPRSPVMYRRQPDARPHPGCDPGDSPCPSHGHDYHARSSHSGRGRALKWIASESNTVQRRSSQDESPVRLNETLARGCRRRLRCARRSDEVWPLVAGILPTLWARIAAFQSSRRRANGASTGAPPVFGSGTGAELRIW
jgi:hypothetical protein